MRAQLTSPYFVLGRRASSCTNYVHSGALLPRAEPSEGDSVPLPNLPLGLRRQSRRSNNESGSSFGPAWRAGIED